MSSFQAQMPSASSLFSAYASISASVMLLRSIFHEFIPTPVRKYFQTLFLYFFKLRVNKLTLVIEEANATGIGRNEVYDAAELYLSTKIAIPSTNCLKISKCPKDKTLTFRFETGEQIDDSFLGMPLRWRFLSRESEKRRSSHEDDPFSPVSTRETKYFELTLDKDNNKQIIDEYLPYIMKKAKSIKNENRTLKLCTLGNKYCGGNVYWDTINLDHPSTFDTLAMEPDVKTAIKADLDRFVSRREFYKRVGRAWKRGYLLHGPPGTGKSSLIAAMANHLKFDIYDLQLGNLIKDSDLRRLLLATANRSILVIEDIDCTVDIKNRENKGTSSDNGQLSHNPPQVQLTLSGLLNFIDGLWSSCGDERIIIFTTNHKEKLDPALVRPGRMDMHIHMSYLTVQGFKMLVSNYLEINGKHRLFGEIERLIETINVTPAQVAEELMRFDDAEEALEGILSMLTKMEVMKHCEQVVIEGENGNDVDDSHLSQNGEIFIG